MIVVMGDTRQPSLQSLDMALPVGVDDGGCGGLSCAKGGRTAIDR